MNTTRNSQSGIILLIHLNDSCSSYFLTGPNKDNPTYNDVCRGDTGHFEAIRIVYDTAITNYESIIKAFLECHDVTQANGQGPDIGHQYRSAIFYFDEMQMKISLNLIAYLNLNSSVEPTESPLTAKN